jgi:hypothetical protein
MGLNLPRTIRMDVSDTFVFGRAAEPGEWAVSGSFLFGDADPTALAGKPRAAFRAGLLGIASFGWSTLAIVSEATEAEHEAATELLARQLHEKLGAPDFAAALAAARAELAFAASLCNHPPQTLIAVHRTWDGRDIREQFRTLRPREGADAAHRYGPVFSFVHTDDEQPAEEVDLVEIMRRGS